MPHTHAGGISCLRVFAAPGQLAALAVLCTANLAFAEDLKLVNAAQQRQAAAVAQLIREKVNVKVAQADGTTALHWAAHWDDVPTATALVRAGAKVTRRTTTA